MFISCYFGNIENIYLMQSEEYEEFIGEIAGKT